MAMRAAGHGMRVLILQFMKGSWTTGELQSLGKVEEIKIKPLGTGFTGEKANPEEDRRLAEAGWEGAVSEIRRGYYDMIVFDELNVVLSHRLLPRQMVLDTLTNPPPGAHFVATGRDAPDELIAIADLVTEMREIKHSCAERGLKAQKGIEF